jgi:hypothetical protein
MAVNTRIRRSAGQWRLVSRLALGPGPAAGVTPLSFGARCGGFTFVVVTILLFVLCDSRPATRWSALPATGGCPPGSRGPRHKFGIDQPITTQFEAFVAALAATSASDRALPDGSRPS